MSKSSKGLHPAVIDKRKRKEKKLWHPSRSPKQLGKRQREGWKCEGRHPNHKKVVLPEKKDLNKELDLECNEPVIWSEEQYQSKPFQEWCRSLQGTGKTSKEPDRTPLSSQECELLICSGEELLEKGGQIPRKGSWKEKIRVENDNGRLASIQDN